MRNLCAVFFAISSLCLQAQSNCDSTVHYLILDADTMPLARFKFGEDSLSNFFMAHRSHTTKDQGWRRGGNINFSLDEQGYIDSLVVVSSGSNLQDKDAKKLVLQLDGNWIPCCAGNPECPKRYFVPYSSIFITYLKNTPDYWSSGVRNIQEERYDLALHDLKKAYRGNPSDPDILYLLGVTYLNLGETKKACKMWKKALAFGKSEVNSLICDHCLK